MQYASSYLPTLTCPADAWPPEYVIESDRHLTMFELGFPLFIDLEIRDSMAFDWRFSRTKCTCTGQTL